MRCFEDGSLMESENVIGLIEQAGLFPGIRLDKPDLAIYAAEMLFDAGIPVAEITMTVPGAIEVIRQLVQRFPRMAIGAGTVLDAEIARQCIDAGACFVTSTGLVPEVVD